MRYSYLAIIVLWYELQLPILYGLRVISGIGIKYVIFIYKFRVIDTLLTETIYAIVPDYQTHTIFPLICLNWYNIGHLKPPCPPY